MPPRSSAQVIESGEYLQPGFDANTLTMPHLLSIFTFHQIQFPVPYSKSRLVETFNEQVKPRAAQLRQERLKREGSVASSRGITDGLTGRSLSDDEQAAEEKPLRRSSRRLSKPPSQPPPPEPPKRRRSSAGPALSRVPTSHAIAPTEPALLEESEPEDEPAKKVKRTRKSVISPGLQGRRISQPDDTEGWSDNNVFQSGAESSSPARPLPKVKGSVTARRSSRRGGRTSLSAPPQMPSSSPFSAPSTAEFGPRIPLEPSFRRFNPDLSSRLSSVQVKTEPRSSSPIPEASEEDVEYVNDDDDMAELDEPDDPIYRESQVLVDDISRTLARGEPSETRRRKTTASPSPFISSSRLVTYVLMMVVSVTVYSYKTKSAALGYCDSGRDTNELIEQRKASWNASEDCVRRLGNSSSESEETMACDLLPFFRWLEPMSCTPCPSHASCTPADVTCDDSFVLRSHPLAQFPLVCSLSNGLPGLGPIAFPAQCVEDEARKRRIGSIGAVLRHRLAMIRGEKLCSGKEISLARDVNEAVKWGAAVDFIRDDILNRLKNAPKRRGQLDEFDKIFKEAISNLEQYGEIVLYTEPETQRQYIASHSIELDAWCKVKLTVEKRWNEWKGYMLGSLVTLVCIFWLRKRYVYQKAEMNRVVELVQVALDTLRNQEMAHHVDPVSTAYSHLSSIHLRDLILQEEHSVPTRRRLWDKVEKIVESNANVRATMEELEGGDIGRVWQWVGNTAITRSP